MQKKAWLRWNPLQEATQGTERDPPALIGHWAKTCTAQTRTPGTRWKDSRRRSGATLTLYPSEGEPSGRLTPIYTNYRPKIAFGPADVSCMFYLSRTLRTLKPGETGPVTVSCDGAVSARAGRFFVKEGGKKVGEVVIRGASTR